LKRDELPIYDGAIQARKIGAFVMGGEAFQVIRPGYCAQGKRRTTWTQVVHEDVPVFEVKLDVDLRSALAQFETHWKRTIGSDKVLLGKALAACKAERRRKFRDGVSGETVAPSITRDGQGVGRRYPT